VAYLDGARVKWASIFGLICSGKGWSILGLELESNGLDHWAGIFEWSWGLMGWFSLKK
jgi:hypothetical protein